VSLSQPRPGLRVAINVNSAFIHKQRTNTRNQTYKPPIAPLSWCSFNSNPDAGIDALPMKNSSKTKATITDSHFLVPLIVFCIGLALLITLH
jgi:hypothetical protein